MLRKSLFAIAVLAFIVTTAQAGDSAENPIKFDEGWPGEEFHYITYDELELCQIPVYLKVGHYVELENCNKKKVVMEQVPCSSIGKGGGDFPCYLGCTNLRIRANFEVKLGTILYKKGDVIGTSGGWHPQDQWEATLSLDTIPPGGAWTTTELCVKAWSADIFYADPGTETLVGEVAITVKPPDLNLL